jgi:hypothetical protein
MIIIFGFLFPDEKGAENQTNQGLVVKTTYKGSYNSVFYDSTNCSSCSSIYYLVEFKLINTTDSVFRFWSPRCHPERNIVIDTKEITLVPNFCTSDSFLYIELEPNQEMSVPLILEARMPFKKEVKIGYIYTDFKSASLEKYETDLIKQVESPKNVIWSEPISFNRFNKHTLEIKEKYLENLSHF